MYSGICDYSSIKNKGSRPCITNGLIYSPPKNKLFLDLIEYINKNRNDAHINYRICVNNLYDILLNKYSNQNQTQLNPGLNKMKDIPDVYLFNEICYDDHTKCYDGKKGKLCCFFYDNDERIMKCRYHDYPWK